MATTISTMKAEFDQSQQDFLQILDQVEEAQLYQNPDEAGWTAGIVLAHITEARQFFAGQIELILVNPGSEVGRTPDNPHRQNAINEYGHAPLAELHERLVSSHQAVGQVLADITDDHLSLTCEYVNRGTFTLEQFIQRLIVGHDRAHVEQVTQLLK